MEGDFRDPAREKACRDDLQYNEVLPKFSATYNFSRTVMVYATTAKGYMAGGFNVLLTPNEDIFTYEPEYTHNVGIHYRSPMGIYARAELFGTDGFYGGGAANHAEQKAYELVNLHFGYEWKGFDLCLWIENIFDTEYLITINWKKSGILSVDGPPRTFGATLTWRY
jgi:outer membrane receptor protein involved in Fe transport